MAEGDDEGLVWHQEGKAWIHPVVSSWVLEEFPGVLEKHGWWKPGTGLDAKDYCICGEVLQPPPRASICPLLAHVATQVAARLVAEEHERSKALKEWARDWDWTGRITWTDELGKVHSWDDTPIRIRRLYDE